MKVQGGSAKGRNIKAPSAKDIRPTSQMVKEAIFDILGEKIKGSAFLDLFAGFGTIGLEALSRGSESVSFVDRSRYAIGIIKNNAEVLGFVDKLKIISADIFKALLKIEGQFDIIFADPPYDFKDYNLLVSKVKELNLLKKDGVFIVERYHKTELSDNGFVISRVKKYGQTALTFFVNKLGD